MLEKINPIAALNKYGIEFRTQDSSDWILVKSPFVPDDTMFNPRGAINSSSGVFRCVKTDKNIPFKSYLSLVTGRKPLDVERDLMNLYDKSPIDSVTDEHIKLWTNLLFADEGLQYRRALIRKGIGPDEILKYELGLNTRGRVTIPVRSLDGMLLNVRNYDVVGHEKVKYTNTKGGVNNALYLPSNLDNDTVFIAGGEIKAINLTEKGFPAVSGTFGEKRWPDALLSRFRGKKVYIVYDVDETGRKAAMKLATQLIRFADEVYDVYLSDVSDIPNGDITDYFYTRNRTAEEFRDFLKTVPKFSLTVKAAVYDDDSYEIESVGLNASISAKYNKKLVRTTAVASAKDTQPYVVPKKVEVRCPRTGQDVCAVCPFGIMSQREDMNIEIQNSDDRLLGLIECSEKGQSDTLKVIAGIPSNCKLSAFQPIESYNIEVVRAIPQISVGHSSEEASPKTIYYVGHGLETNTPYEFLARNTCEPRTQRSTLLVTQAERAMSDIDTFELEHDLRIFSPAEWTLEALKVKLDDIYEDLENNVTGIFHRRDMHIAIDLVYHSALYINFQNKTHKAWTDILIIGDSGQGKSEASSRLLGHYKAGEKVDTKRATAAGLVGGAQQTNKRWFITWGTIPLNDRRCVVLEEVKGAQEEVLGKLTDMRSSGVADLQMVERAKTNARTRLLWISNPRSSRNISEYNYAVDAIKELMGNLEDVRRFDMAIAVATGEVSEDILNGEGYDSNVPHFITSDLCNHLIMWAWSRRPEQILVEDEAASEILAASKRMSRLYSSSIPLVEPSDQRHKILRLASALAARTFSTDDGEQLVIRLCHVKFIEEYLCRIYDSETMGYRTFSKSRFTEAAIEDVDDVITELQSLPNNRSLGEAMLYSDNINWTMIADFTDLERELVHKTIGILVRNGALKPVRRGGYRKTPAFIQLLKDLLRDDKLVDGEVKLIGEV